LHDGVTNLFCAFLNCSSLKEITVPRSVENLSSAFSGCTALESAKLPDNLTAINGYAFYDCRSLASIDIPSTLYNLEGSAFRNCSSLTSVRIPAGIGSISDHTFSGCSGLTEITVPEGIHSIDTGAFSDCTSLTSVWLPSTLDYMGRAVFMGCDGIERIWLPKDEPFYTSDNIFERKVYDEATLYVPETANMEYYNMIEPWSYFVNVEGFDFSGVEEVSGGYDPSVKCDVYDLQGHRVAGGLKGLPGGIYIVRQQGKAFIRRVAAGTGRSCGGDGL
ncbi:MAG: leucine-rich repeat domain-containing protein, partial [Muribaculaceae bacterium]|nr:leucine-rich repeat domain-containing protein [Muribaculaceae bacterium]